MSPTALLLPQALSHGLVPQGSGESAGQPYTPFLSPLTRQAYAQEGREPRYVSSAEFQASYHAGVGGGIWGCELPNSSGPNEGLRQVWAVNGRGKAPGFWPSGDPGATLP